MKTIKLSNQEEVALSLIRSESFPNPTAKELGGWFVIDGSVNARRLLRRLIRYDLVYQIADKHYLTDKGKLYLKIQTAERAVQAAIATYHSALSQHERARNNVVTAAEKLRRTRTELKVLRHAFHLENVH